MVSSKIFLYQNKWEGLSSAARITFSGGSERHSTRVPCEVNEAIAPRMSLFSSEDAQNHWNDATVARRAAERLADPAYVKGPRRAFTEASWRTRKWTRRVKT